MGCTKIPHHYRGWRKCSCGNHSLAACSQFHHTAHGSAILVHFQVQIVCNLHHNNHNMGSSNSSSSSSSNPMDNDVDIQDLALLEKEIGIFFANASTHTDHVPSNL